MMEGYGNTREFSHSLFFIHAQTIRFFFSSIPICDPNELFPVKAPQPTQPIFTIMNSEE